MFQFRDARLQIDDLFFGLNRSHFGSRSPCMFSRKSGLGEKRIEIPETLDLIFGSVIPGKRPVNFLPGGYRAIFGKILDWTAPSKAETNGGLALRVFSGEDLPDLSLWFSYNHFLFGLSFQLSSAWKVCLQERRQLSIRAELICRALERTTLPFAAARVATFLVGEPIAPHHLRETSYNLDRNTYQYSDKNPPKIVSFRANFARNLFLVSKTKAEKMENFLGGLTAIAQERGLELDGKWLYSGGNPASVRSVLTSKGAVSFGDIEAELIRASLVAHFYGTARLSDKLPERRRKAFGDESQLLMEKGFDAYAVLLQNPKAVPGMTVNSVVSAVPEFGILTLMVDQSRPAPSVLQLPLRERERASMEEHFDSLIGSEKSRKEDISEENAKAAKALQRRSKMGASADPLHGGEELVKTTKSVEGCLTGEIAFEHESRMAAIVEAAFEDPNTFLERASGSNFLAYLNSLEIPKVKKEAAAKEKAKSTARGSR